VACFGNNARPRKVGDGGDDPARFWGKEQGDGSSGDLPKWGGVAHVEEGCGVLFL
jgi:hypothetical protein